MITRIEMTNVATFNSIGVSVDNMKKINYFYGANGSGKTTISNFLQSPNDEKYAKCSIEWENDLPIEILTFNKTFRDQNFNATSKIAGVFTLGNATIEQKKAIEDKKTKLSEIEKDGKQKKNQKKNLKKIKINALRIFARLVGVKYIKKTKH